DARSPARPRPGRRSHRAARRERRRPAHPHQTGGAGMTGPADPASDAALVQSPWEQLDRILPPAVSLRLLQSDRPPTLRERVPVWPRWLLQPRGRSPLTVRYYAQCLRQFIEYCDGFQVEDPRAISEAVIETYLAAMTGRGLKPATVSQALHALRSLF